MADQAPVEVEPQQLTAAEQVTGEVVPAMEAGPTNSGEEQVGLYAPLLFASSELHDRADGIDAPRWTPPAAPVTDPTEPAVATTNAEVAAEATSQPERLLDAEHAPATESIEATAQPQSDPAVEERAQGEEMMETATMPAEEPSAGGAEAAEIEGEMERVEPTTEAVAAEVAPAFSDDAVTREPETDETTNQAAVVAQEASADEDTRGAEYENEEMENFEPHEEVAAEDYTANPEFDDENAPGASPSDDGGNAPAEDVEATYAADDESSTVAGATFDDAPEPSSMSGDNGAEGEWAVEGVEDEAEPFAPADADEERKLSELRDVLMSSIETQPEELGAEDEGAEEDPYDMETFEEHLPAAEEQGMNGGDDEREMSLLEYQEAPLWMPGETPAGLAELVEDLVQKQIDTAKAELVKEAAAEKGGAKPVHAKPGKGRPAKAAKKVQHKEEPAKTEKKPPRAAHSLRKEHKKKKAEKEPEPQPEATEKPTAYDYFTVVASLREEINLLRGEIGVRDDTLEELRQHDEDLREYVSLSKALCRDAIDKNTRVLLDRQKKSYQILVAKLRREVRRLKFQRNSLSDPLIELKYFPYLPRTAYGTTPRKPPSGIVGNLPERSCDYFPLNPPPPTGNHSESGNRWWWGSGPDLHAHIPPLRPFTTDPNANFRKNRILRPATQPAPYREQSKSPLPPFPRTPSPPPAQQQAPVPPRSIRKSHASTRPVEDAPVPPRSIRTSHAVERKPPSPPPTLPALPKLAPHRGAKKEEQGMRELRAGDRACVIINDERCLGLVKYVGIFDPLPEAGLWVGLKLDRPLGKHNGVVRGKRYFTCETNHGLFVKIDKVTPLIHQAGMIKPSPLNADYMHRAGPAPVAV
ncbi:hypothetical protein HK101_010002 [Irineochytrium annulatum]|nr:hypothetical protein HK101_010002 [Irineochytrium annulatum]